ncbi:serine peptidase [Streptomyces sp. NBC_00829]|uniref:serine peptidase n=1 Tax=Streptomyces sp. NBC_00829 TaxID=2903679 RepID=UPI0038658443|nr:serine peptidase [Streptomyces sp. NBC_00829]WTB19095.1 serine peptidase [Streptomyces sp. NBC_00829]
MKILGVHGVHNYQAGLHARQASHRLATWWRDAILNGLEAESEEGRLGVDVAYYAHHLHRGIAQGDDDPAHLDPVVQRHIVEWATLLGAPQVTAQGRLTVPVRSAVDWVADRYGLDHRLVRIFVTKFFRELDLYFSDPVSREAARSEVVDAVIRHRPDVIIAHSLGSVIAYEALWTMGPSAVDLLVTLGSPLAMPDVVYERLAPHPGPRARPPGVARWINIADPGDFVAVPQGGVAARFADLTANLQDVVGVFSYHKATSYLACGAVSGIIASHL